MKKIVMFFLICFLFVLCGCNKTDEKDYHEQRIEDSELLNTIISSNQEGIVEMLTSKSFYRLYTDFIQNDLNNLTFREGTVSNERKFICGYLLQSTIKKIEKNKIYIQSGPIRGGIEGYFDCYVAGLNLGELGEEDQLFLFTFENEIPYVFKNFKLIFVIEEADISFSNGEHMIVLDSLRGSIDNIENNIFIIPELVLPTHEGISWNWLDPHRGNKYLILTENEQMNKTQWLYLFNLQSIEIENYQEQNVIMSVFPSTYKETDVEFFNLFDPLVVGETTLYGRPYSYLDYNGIKEILEME